MPKMSMNELKKAIAEIIYEAKKEKKAEKIAVRNAAVEAYGHYDEAHDFSKPLGDKNRMRQQGQVNWGPYTSAGSDIETSVANPNASSAANQMKESDERALRALVREVLENGLIDEQSAWAPFLKRAQPIFESSWEEAALRLTEKNWFDKKNEADKPAGRAFGIEKDKSRGPIKKHGMEKK